MSGILAGNSGITDFGKVPVQLHFAAWLFLDPFLQIRDLIHYFVAAVTVLVVLNDVPATIDFPQLAAAQVPGW